MRPLDAVGDYLTLALRLDRLLPGMVGTCTGESAVPPVLAAAVAAARGGPPPRAADLVRAAGRLSEALPGALGAERSAFLRSQLVAMEWTARRLAGQGVSYVQEVAAAFDVRIALGDEERYRRAHQDLDALLPGAGPLAQRLAAHHGREEVPPARIAECVVALSRALRERTRATVPLPAGESVEYRVVDDAPWSALHRYAGPLRSVVTVNAATRPRRAQLAQLVAHEVYPGHHTERCRKETGLLAAGWDEHRVVLAATPQSLVAEGAAEIGLRAVVGPGWGRFAADVLGGLGLGFDGELAERVDAATSVLARARQDAALMLHGQGRPAAEVTAHLRRWMLVDQARALRVLRFLRHRLWRSYTTTYVEGAALAGRWWDHDPRPERFLRLLDEPLTPHVLRVEGTAERWAAERVPVARRPRRAVSGKR